MLDETIAMYDAAHPVQANTIEDTIKKSSYSELMGMKKQLQSKTLGAQISDLEEKIKVMELTSRGIGYGDSKEDIEYNSLIKSLTVLRSIETQEKSNPTTSAALEKQIEELEKQNESASKQKLEELKNYRDVVKSQELLSVVDGAIQEKEANQNNEDVKKEFKEYAKETIEETKKEKASDNELNRLRNKFLQGVDDFTQEEAVHFLEAWSSKELEWDGGLSRKTKLDVNMTSENAEKIAKLINKLPDTGDEKN